MLGFYIHAEGLKLQPEFWRCWLQMELAVCNTIAQGTWHQSKGLVHLCLIMILEGLVAVAASISPCQFTFGGTGFRWIEGDHITSAVDPVPWVTAVPSSSHGRE